MAYEVDVSISTHALPERFVHRVPDRGEVYGLWYITYMPRTCPASVWPPKPCGSFKLHAAKTRVMRMNLYNKKLPKEAKLIYWAEDRSLSDAVNRSAALALPTLPSDWWRRIRKKIRHQQTTTTTTLDIVTTTTVTKGSGIRNRTARCPPVPKRHGLSKVSMDAVTFVKLNEKSSYERITHWLLWMYFSGVDRVYMYDVGYHLTDKCVTNAPGVTEMIHIGFLVVKKWEMAKWPSNQQLHIWRDANMRFPTAKWRAFLTLRSYLFSTFDLAKGFLRRHIDRVPSQVGVVQLQSAVFSAGATYVKHNGSWPIRLVRRTAVGEDADNLGTAYIAHMQKTCDTLSWTARPCLSYKVGQPHPDKLRANVYDSRASAEKSRGKKVEDTKLQQIFLKAITSANSSVHKKKSSD